MKRLNLLVLCVFLIFLISCEEADTSVQTNAELSVEVPMSAWQADDVLASKSASSVSSLYNFRGSASFCLANKDNLSNCPGAVLGVAPGSGARIVFNGLEGANEIQSINIVWGYASAGSIDFQMQNPVELLGNGQKLSADEFSLELDDFLQPVIQQIDKNPRALIFISIYGNSNFEMSVHADLKAPVIVESDIASPRFTL
ncbi:MAG: hypothetical protein ACK5M7_13450 [Draconibacterium sp.]